MDEDGAEVEAADKGDMLEEFSDVLRQQLVFIVDFNVESELLVPGPLRFFLLDVVIDWHLKRVRPVFLVIIDHLFLLSALTGAKTVHFIRPLNSLFLFSHTLTLLAQKCLRLEVKDVILGGIEGIAALGCYIGGNILDGALLLDVFQNPFIDQLVD